MSLLMDALKKAERARAARQDDDDGDVGEQPLSLDPMEPRPGVLGTPGGIERGAENVGLDASGRTDDTLGSSDAYAAPDSAAAPAAFELEDFSDEDAERDNGDFDHARMEATDDSLGLSLSEEQLRSVEDSLPDRPLPRDQGNLAIGSDAPDATAATLPSLKAARDSVNTYFDGTSSGSLAMEQVRRGVDDDTTITGQRAVHERDTQQQHARAVFAAKAARRPSSVGRWVLFLGLPVVLVAAAVGMYFYWLASGGNTFRGPAMASNPAARTAPAARVPTAGAGGRTTTGVSAGTSSAASRSRVGTQGTRQGTQATAPSGTANTPSSTLASGSPNSSPGISAARAAPLTGTTPAAAPTLSAANARAASAPASGDLSPARAIGAESASPSPTVQGPAVLSDAQFEQMLRQRAALPKGFDASGGIKITRGRGRARTTSGLAHAYEHYVNGELSRAEQTYRGILGREPRNRDALLGLAAISLRYGDIDAAKARYLRVLAVHPQDAVAQAALIDVFTDLDPVAGETQLKGLIAREPGAGYLHFALGNTYARQARWSEAQAAYFEAFRTDDANPDYVYNLAVSLDQLGQRDAARQYYQQALELGGRRPGGFSFDVVRARLRDLGAS